MAIFRNIQMSFWTDPKIADDFAPEDKYFYLYLLTNPHTNLCGCYEISFKQIADETGYSKQTVEKLLARAEKEHRVIVYSKKTKELLLVNWSKYNWTSSEKFRMPLKKEIQNVKNIDFKAFLEGLLYGTDTVSIPYPYPTDTTDSVSDTDTNTKSDSDRDSNKHIYGEYKHVRLTQKQYDKLVADFGEDDTKAAIRKLDEYMQMKGKSYKDHNLVMRNWVFDAVRKDKQNGNMAGRNGTDEEQHNRELDEHIARIEAGEFDAEDEELRRMWDD